MSDLVQVIIGTIIIFLCLFLSLMIKNRRIKKEYESIIHYLKANKAYDPNSAVELPYAEKSFLRMGIKNFHSDAIKTMVSNGIVFKTKDGKFYSLFGSNGKSTKVT